MAADTGVVPFLAAAGVIVAGVAGVFWVLALPVRAREETGAVDAEQPVAPE
ncbi:hypothetical protein [Haladaptatus sp. NG-SE-30]